MHISSTYDLCVFIYTIFSVSSQIYTFFVVIFKSPNAMSEYRYFLCTFIFWDTIYNISIGFFALPVPLFPAFGFISRGLNEELYGLFGANSSKFLWCTIVWCGVDLLQLQFFCLQYRFHALHPNENMRKWFMSWPSMIVQHILGYAVCFGVATPIWFTIVDEQNYPAYMARYDPLTFNEIKPGDVVGFLDVDSPIWKYYCIVAMIGFCFFFFGSLLLSAYIIRQLARNARKYSAKTYRLHLQLSIILVVQIVLPLIFVMGPLSILFMYMVYWKQPLTNMAAYIGVSLLTVYPSTNVLITIFGVTPYRNFTINWIIAIGHFIRRPCFGKPRIQPGGARSGSLASTVVPN